MANRYSNRSDRDRNRDRNRGENLGGSRREQNFNEYNRGQNFSGGQSSGGSRGSGQQFSGAQSDFSGGYNQSFGSSYSPGQNYSGQSFGGSWDQNRDYSQGGSSSSSDFRNVGRHYGGGSQGNFGSERERNFDRYSTGRDFMTNQPEFSSYGSFDDSQRGSQSFGRRSSRDYGNEFRYSEPSSSFNRDYAERGGYSGSSYGSYGDRDFDSGRTAFDESIAGRSYYGSGSGSSEREGWRGYGSRPGNLGFGDRERPDDWNRNAYGGGNFSGSENRQYGSRSGRDFFNTDYGSTQYGSYDRNRDDSWSFNRDRGDRGESFGDKVKNFFGMGPKGYRRSDERIKEDISERLEDHPAIDASNIEVQVRDGEVTLTGTTDNRYAKRLAEDVADQCRGVKDVHNQIRVQSTGTGESGRTGTIQGDLTSGSRSSSTSETGTSGTTGSSGKKGSERAA